MKRERRGGQLPRKIFMSFVVSLRRPSFTSQGAGGWEIGESHCDGRPVEDGIWTFPFFISL